MAVFVVRASTERGGYRRGDLTPFSCSVNTDRAVAGTIALLDQWPKYGAAIAASWRCSVFSEGTTDLNQSTSG